MQDRNAVGVLSPLLGGFYFGGLLTGVADACLKAGSRVVAVQTFDPGLQDTAYQECTDFRYPVAWGHIGGLVVILNAANPEYLTAIRESGLPTVTISQEYPELTGPVILSDNRSGVTAAVEHLIHHGHRRIAFAGHLSQHDIRERYETYRESLAANGLSADPRLLYPAGDNLLTGGREAGRSMIADGLPATALIAATDFNAIGIMEVLTSAGYRIPEDLAVVGFDDTAEATHTQPSLSTVRQRFDELGRQAAALLLERMQGREIPQRRHYVATSFIARESCGCPAPGPGPGRRRPAAAAARSRDRDLFQDTSYFKGLLGVQYEVSMDLLLSHIENPRTLSWLQRTAAQAGCLGLWVPESDEGNHHNLQVVGAYDQRGPQLDACVGAAVPVDQFPPAEVIRLVDDHPGDVVHVVPVRMRSSDWGMLAVVGPVDDRMSMGRETVNQWAALLSVALDREAVFESLRQREESLRRAALYDPLTGLPNRVLFADRVRAAIDSSHQHPHRRFAVLFLDLDGFKVVNDSLGHHFGDRLLVQVATRITRALRRGDMAARLGGDEFAVLVDGIDGSHTPESVTARLKSTLSAPFHLDGQDVVVSASIGIALSTEHYEHEQDVLRDADIAMYRAKSQAKGSHAKFDVEMRALAMSRLQTEADLRRSVERDEFELHYQPIVDMDSGRTTGLEALIRWRHPTRGLLQPVDFIAVAEEVGLTVPIGRWALRQVAHDLRRWTDAGHIAGDFRVNVNVSNKQFWHTDLLDDIHNSLGRVGLTTRRLALEITEGVIMQNAEAAGQILRGLHDAGLQLDIDDFGTGYSSLSALLELPIDRLKIDRSFVVRLVTDDRNRELVRAIVRMAHNLGLKVIAEGVETTAQRDQLLRLDCRYGQGYLFSGALPFQFVTEQLSARNSRWSGSSATAAPVSEGVAEGRGPLDGLTAAKPTLNGGST